MVGPEESNEALAKARRHQWTQISPASQASFATSLIPGLEPPAREESVHSGDAGPEKDGGVGEGTVNRDRPTRQKRRVTADAEGKGEPPKEPVSDDFCLVLLWPQFVDHLRLGDT